MTEEPKFFPIFSGTSDDGAKIVIYRAKGLLNDQLVIKEGDGELWALSPGAKLTTWTASDGMKTEIHVRIVSEEWTGHAVGTRKDLVAEETR